MDHRLLSRREIAAQLRHLGRRRRPLDEGQAVAFQANVQLGRAGRRPP